MDGELTSEEAFKIQKIFLSLNTLMAHLNLEISSPIYEDLVKKYIPSILEYIKLIDYRLTGRVDFSDVETDIGLLNSLYYSKSAAIYLSTDKNLEPAFIKINIRDLSIQVYGPQYIMDRFNKLLEIRDDGLKRIRKEAEEGIKTFREFKKL